MNIRKQINTKIRELSTVSNEKFKILINKFLNTLVEILATSNQLKKEFIDYDGIYQICITDINFNCWFKLNKGIIIYQKGINKESNITFYIKKGLLLEIIRLKKGASDSYMKGLIKLKGDLSYALKFRNILNLIVKYIIYITKNEKNR